MSWLADLKKRMAEVPEKYLAIEKPPPAPNENVVGRLPEDLMRLYGLHRQMRDEFRALGTEHEARCHGDCTDKEECVEFQRRALWLRQEQNTVAMILTTAIFAEFGLHAGTLVDIRAHGDVVIREPMPVVVELDLQEVAPDVLQAMITQMQKGGEPN